VSQQPAPATGEVTTGTAPALSIGTPSSRITVKAGMPVILTASASDAEDGDLSSRINWTSSVDGRVATGASATAILSPGVHRLTATVVDSGNLSAQAVVVVTVVREP
jgi:hypothetical protein